MARLDKENITRLVKFERLGYIATAFCGVVTVAMAVLYAVAQSLDIPALRTTAIALFPALLALGIANAAYFHLKYGGEMKREIDAYVRAVLIENAALMHPEKSELLFCLMPTDTYIEVKVNNFKESIKFDFSAFGKLSVMRKSAVCNAIGDRISTTFCKLYERGAKYTAVSYYLAGLEKKKAISVIRDGQPDKRAFKQYLKAGN